MVLKESNMYMQPDYNTTTANNNAKSQENVKVSGTLFARACVMFAIGNVYKNWWLIC